jgi:type IV pilus assembly protein PilM
MALMSLKQQCQSLWKNMQLAFRRYGVGLDIGSQSVKLVVLKPEANDLSVAVACQAALPEGAVVGHRIRDVEAVGKVLKSLLEQHPLPSNKVAIALPNTEVITQSLSVDSAFLNEDEATIEQLLLLEMEKHIPYPLTEMTVDYQVMGSQLEEQHKVEVLVVVAKTEVISSYLSVLAYAGLQPLCIDVEQYALARTYPWLDISAFPKREQLCLGLISFGANFAAITVLEGTSSLYCQEQRISMESQISLDFISQWIERALSLFYATGLRDEVDGILLMGGNYPKQDELLHQLTQRLGLPVAWANPFAHVNVGSEVAGLNQAYVLSMGLAVRGIR